MKKNLSCPICEALGKELFVDFDEGKSFQDAFYKLEMVLWLSESHDLRRCPKCGVYYYFTFETDNDIFQPTHTGEYKRISKEEAERIMEEERVHLEKVREENRNRVHKLHGKVIRELPEIEKRVVEYLTDRLYAETSIDEICNGLGMEISLVKKAVACLKDKGVVEEYRYDKLHVKYHIRRI